MPNEQKEQNAPHAAEYYGLQYRIVEKGVVIAVKVIPKSSKNEVAGTQNGALKLKVTAPPEKGKANAECQRVLSGVFDVAKNKIYLVAGEKNKHKTFVIENLDEQSFLKSVKKNIREK